MYIGVTLVFCKEKHDSIEGILKSLVLNTNKMNFEDEVHNVANEISEHYNAKYLGINDVFIVSGIPKEGEVLGRISYFEYDDRRKSEKLKGNFSNTIIDCANRDFLCSIIYFCQNDKKEFYTITVLTVIELNDGNFENKIKNIGNDSKFKDKVIETSIDGLNKLDYIGIERFEEICIEYNIFERLYSDFENLEFLVKEVIPNNELKMILEDVFFSK
ncbi:hypothetical protein [Flavobacterium psychrophilum]|uniref:Uncharacterized protein n=1 Tax=Flavobacterium psychrophilum TaxID=96345 RepID=A0A7U2NGQ7_FLAPS|nr:hypothetical protein [Flavobacterium psychrophilum]EKT3958431.1 hypothetical protein [Flavobacterium psychrophilum]EKT4510759.1 hypothetical protein [Flavobacterium psychrophilum]ELM3645149.1 hypothetical protein [Flavobacterium psychrophilum]MCB6089461.1 hypothetical protein [Flavobacterium psychrophilum]MCB6232041.1 hypothetical protein [Flavobacterium psychrophilum]